jgi:arsenate reductase
MSVSIYHNPRCSKSRQALQILRERAIEPHIIAYLQTPPDHATLESILQMLRMEPRELMRKKEPQYQTLGLDEPTLSRQQLIAAMVAHPQLIERPIVINDGKAALGRPPEQIVEIL